MLAGLPLADGQPVYAVGCSVWPRCDAAASPERGFYYHPSRHSSGQPIVAGWSYQWLAQVGFARESWTAPMDVRRLPAAGPVPLFVFDAGDNAVTLQRGLDACRTALLVRLRSGRCFYGDPPAMPPRPLGGRLFRHGHKLVCADPATWPVPTDERTVEDTQYGTVRIRAWSGLHPKVQDRTGHGTTGPSLIVPMTLVLVEVSRLPGRPYPPQVCWLWLHAPAGYAPDLDLFWRAYVRRFDLEHTLRVRHPEQADRWTWLVLAAYTQLRLARALVADRRLPWARRNPPGRLTPTASAGRFRHCCWRSARPPACHNPAAARQGDRKATAPAPRRATRPSRRPPDAACGRVTPPPRRSSQSVQGLAWLNYKPSVGQQATLICLGLNLLVGALASGRRSRIHFWPPRL